MSKVLVSEGQSQLLGPVPSERLRLSIDLLGVGSFLEIYVHIQRHLGHLKCQLITLKGARCQFGSLSQNPKHTCMMYMSKLDHVYYILQERNSVTGQCLFFLNVSMLYILHLGRNNYNKTHLSFSDPLGNVKIQCIILAANSVTGRLVIQSRELIFAWVILHLNMNLKLGTTHFRPLRPNTPSYHQPLWLVGVIFVDF